MQPFNIQAFHIPPVNQPLTAVLQKKIDQKTKPLGALGWLEKIALQVGLIQNTLEPHLHRPVAMVFAADHGVVAEGVSPYPQVVTQQMVLNFLQGGAAVNVFARQNGMVVRVVDAGVNHAFTPHPDLVDRKIGMGTGNILAGPAMTADQCEQAMASGAQLAMDEISQGTNVLAFGEMGIGNTTAAAAIMSAITRLPPEACAGRGTGLDDAGMQKKIEVIRQALALHAGHLDNPLDILTRVGGFEIAMMTGCMLRAASEKALLLIDGFICTAALLVAAKLQPNILQYCIFAHCSDEQGHRLMLDHLHVEPLLHLGLRLGEGTGAILAYPLVQAAVNFLNEMASFASAGVSEKNA